MNRYQVVLSVIALGVLLAGSYTWAADTTPSTTDPAKGNSPAVTSAQLPEQARANMPDDVKKMIEKFRTDRETFLADQKKAIKDWKDSKAEDRAALRKELLANREKFVADQKTLRDDIRVRMVEIRTEFKNDRDKVTGAAQEAKENAKQFKDRNRGTTP